jgi:hypothetical protein
MRAIPCAWRTCGSITRDWLPQSRTQLTQFETKERVTSACLHRISRTITILAPALEAGVNCCHYTGIDTITCREHVIDVWFKMEDYLATQFLSLRRLETCEQWISKPVPHELILHTIARSIAVALELLECLSTSRKEVGTHYFPSKSKSSSVQAQRSSTRVCVRTKCVKNSSIDGLTI